MADHRDRDVRGPMLDAEDTEPLHTFRVHLDGNRTRVQLDGVELQGLRDVRLVQSMEGSPIVTIEFLAKEVKGLDG